MIFISQENGNFHLKTNVYSTETSNLITSKDHASVQINVGTVDANGHYVFGHYKTVAFTGDLRKNGESDNALNRFALENKIMKDV